MKIPRLLQFLFPLLLFVVVFSVPDPKRKSGMGYPTASPFVSVLKPGRPAHRPRPFSLPIARPISVSTRVDWDRFTREAASATPVHELDVGSLPETQGWERLHCTFTGPLPDAEIASLTDVTVGSGALHFDSMGFSASRTTSVYRRPVVLPALHALQFKARLRVAASELVGKPLRVGSSRLEPSVYLQKHPTQTGFALGLGGSTSSATKSGSGSAGTRVRFGVATSTVSEFHGLFIARGDYTRTTEFTFQYIHSGNWRFLIDGKPVMHGGGDFFLRTTNLLFGDWNDGMQISADLESLELKVFPTTVTPQVASGPLMDHSAIIRHIEKVQAESRARFEARKRGLASGVTVPVSSPAVRIFLPPRGESIVATMGADPHGEATGTMGVSTPSTGFASGDDFSLPGR